MNNEALRAWVGRQEIREDLATAAPLNGMAATLDHQAAQVYALGDIVPPLWHWAYFLPTPRQSQLGTDGHPVKGGFLPPISLPRRMWAGSQIEFLRPVHVGEKISRRSTISDVSFKEGRTGSLAFVKLRHETSNEGGIAIVENQDIVYRNPPKPGEGPATPTIARTDAHWSRKVQPTAPLLFRYSALTFNGHRIHYDRPYAEREEGYSGLVVHGPLIATLLLDLLRSELPAARVVAYDFRAVRPLLDTTTFEVCGRTSVDGAVNLWAMDSEGILATSATARLA